MDEKEKKDEGENRGNLVCELRNKRKWENLNRNWGNEAKTLNKTQIM